MDAAKLTREISPNDKMYNEARQDRYFRAGQSAIDWIRLALQAATKERVETILDLPCGHGRVLRWFRHEFPQADVTACDIDRDAVDFCANTFGAHPVYSTKEPAEIAIPGPFDLIWCGSLLTHLNSARSLGFLRLFESLLSEDGILCFTTAGRYVAQRMRERAGRYGRWDPVEIRGLLEEYDRAGSGYSERPPGSGRGFSIDKPSSVCSQIERLPLRLICASERAWLDSQDIFACVRWADAHR
jgi:SAM-dependent methyltransferase